MKTLSIKSPWAYYIAWGVQTIERRSWSTAYRGPLAIHATGTEYDILPPLVDGSTPLHKEANDAWSDKAGGFVFTGREKLISEQSVGGQIVLSSKTPESILFVWGYARAFEGKTPYPIHAIIGTVDLVDITKHGTEYQWHLDNPTPREKPITNVRGKLGLWDFSGM